MTATAPLEQADFFRDAIAAYGYEGAREIGACIIRSFQASQQRLPLLRPVEHLKIRVADQDVGIAAFANNRQNCVKISLDASMDVEKLLENIPPMTEHEFAHLAHAQQNPRLYQGPAALLWWSTIKEGVAQVAEYNLDEDYDPACAVWWDGDISDEQMDEALIQLLYYPGEQQQGRRYPYLFGQDTFALDGYTIGHRVVASVAAYHGYDLLELMRLPLDAYREFAETKL